MASPEHSPPLEETTVPLPEEETAAAEAHWFWIDEEPYLHPTWPGTIAILVSMGVGYLLMNANDSSSVARIAGIALLAGLLVSVLSDLRVSLRNLIRIDLAALFSLFFLTFFEFFADQPAFDNTVSVFDAKQAITAVYLGFAGLALGRHFIRPGTGVPFEGDVGFPGKLFLLLVFGFFFLGNLYAFLSVKFNFIDWLWHLGGARFSQPWARGRLGGWSTLLGEFQLLLLAVPALSGVIYARARRYNALQLALVTVVLLLTLYQAFAGGTRNLLAMNLAALLGGYLIVQRRLKLKKCAISGLATAIAFIFLSHHQLQFRGFGLNDYVRSGAWKQELVPSAFRFLVADDSEMEDGNEFHGLFIDLNLRNIAGLTEAFPDRFAYIGLNMPFVALTKPIPRALWKNKPEDFKVGIEQALSAAGGYTLSCTFVGEAYMMGGNVGVVITGILFGAMFMYWNRLGSRSDSVFQRLIFALLFVPALISMRSITSLTTFLLVALALIVLGYFSLRYFNEDDIADESD